MFYIIGTSIGNIKDTSYRAVETLVNCDLILAEDSRSFSNYYLKIQELFNLHPTKKQKIIPFHDRNEFEMVSELLHIEHGASSTEHNIGLVSESGMPGVSDPGNLLIQTLVKNNINYTVIPGPTAFATAAVLSGFKYDSILFVGFLPKKRSEIERIFDRTDKTNPIIVFYESPYRINKTTQILKEIIPDAEIAICREITKKFEEVIRAKINELPSDLKVRGEITVVIKINP